MTILADLPLPPKPILVVGGYGYRNAGDEAILAGLLDTIGRDGVTVVSRSPAETAATHGVETVSIRKAASELRYHRGVLIGGGGLFGRDMGRLGSLLPLAGLLATLARRDVALVGIGVDAELPPVRERLLGTLARRATTVVVRDAASVTLMRRLGVEAELRPDLSSVVPSAGRAAGVRHLRAVGLRPERRPVMGLCVTALDPGIVERLAVAIETLVDSLPDFDFCLFPMSRHPFLERHNDEVFARQLMVRRPRLRLLVPPDDPSEVLAVFEAFSAALCVRYHSLLFAERAGIPIIPVPYAEKCHHWLAERSLEPADLTPGAIVERFGGLARRAVA
ncbi:MAG TPA: polysaccharide pyruvyl transferase family protein [Candidatus Dormibacteraeota bacterium]|nr:polysaccharide pyruvyl transferase family protein [Candidatus Dormibacteraeota bacterium]